MIKNKSFVTDLSLVLDPISVEPVQPVRDDDNQCQYDKDNSDDDKHNNYDNNNDDNNNDDNNNDDNNNDDNNNDDNNNDDNDEKNRSPLALGC